MFFKRFPARQSEKQRQFILPKLFNHMNEIFIDSLYDKFANYSKNKGFIICACDGSIMDLPNVILTRKEFQNNEKNSIKTQNQLEQECLAS